MGMKRTLLEMTQDILTSLNGDEVATINDTTESRDVATTIRQCFYDIVSSRELPELTTPFQLNETSSTSPVILTRPTDIITMEWLKYNVNEDTGDFQRLTFLPFEEFMAMQHALNLEDITNVNTFQYTVNGDVLTIPYGITSDPTYWTSWDDSTVLVDSLNEDKEAGSGSSYLRSTKTLAFGVKESSWSHTDSFVPPLDHKLFNLLYQEAKATCFVEQKQTENVRAERRARQGWLTLAKDKHDVKAAGRGYHNSAHLPNYGRK